MKVFSQPRLLAGALLLCWQVTLHADPIATPYLPTFRDVGGLGNTVVTDAWTNLSIENDPGYPGISGSQVWTVPIAPDSASERQSFFRKGPNATTDTTDFMSQSAGGGIYSFFSNTHFEITSGLALPGLDTLQLQISMAEGATGVDVFAGPTLTLFTTAGTFTLAPTNSSLLSSLDVTIPAFGDTPTTINLEAYQWNLAAYAGTITSVQVDWQVDTHSITYGAQLAQATQAVPEPGSTLLMALGCSIAVLRFRSRMRRTA